MKILDLDGCIDRLTKMQSTEKLSAEHHEIVSMVIDDLKAIRVEAAAADDRAHKFELLGRIAELAWKVAFIFDRISSLHGR